MVAHAAKKRLLPSIARRTWIRSGRRSAASATREDCRHKYRVLAIETSCDDTSVALVTARKYRGTREGQECAPKWALESHYHERLTANNEAHRGIHPLVALESHRANTAPLVKQALKVLQAAKWGQLWGDHGRLDFVAVTRGPGMRSNLSVGLDTAKGIAAALDIPLVGVHHMQAHALTPRLMTAVANADESQKHEHCTGAKEEKMTTLEPAFPFLTLLVSGGHTMLLDSRGLTEHRLLAETGDIAVGQFLDKAARAILLPELLEAPYGRALEDFAFQTVGEYGSTSGSRDERTIEDPAHDKPCQAQYEYSPPQTQQDLMKRHDSPWGWSLSPPLVERAGGESKRMAYSFAGLLTFVERLVTQRAADTGGVTLAERRALAEEVQRVAFEHLASRVLLYLTSRQAADWKGDTIVVSGGVAANKFLRHVLRSILDARGFGHIEVAFPPIELSTDNALMIAWAGIEMYDAGWRSSLDIGPIRKWSLDPTAPDGGILGAPGWRNEE
ncbi:Mitochondrial tRNAs modification protein [Friedmanniomyces endolithicus]|nr:Mitochondrial tRNAs modification protein [Friedmanniomyces endolithicus]